MKAILMSIQPKWVAKILNKEKTIEVRKRFPLDYRGWVYIYCTKEEDLFKSYIRMGYYTNRSTADDLYYNGRGKVVARFWCDNVEEIICRTIWGEWESYTKTLGYSEISQASCLENREIVHYLKGNNGYAIHISQLEIFDDPKELSEFKQEWYDCGNNFHSKPLTKAPQSYMYIEVEE